MPQPQRDPKTGAVILGKAAIHGQLRGVSPALAIWSIVGGLVFFVAASRLPTVNPAGLLVAFACFVLGSYWMLVGAYNRVVVRLEGDRLTTVEEPFRVGRKRSVPVDGIEQIYVKGDKQLERPSDVSNSSKRGRARFVCAYHLVARTHDGQRIHLIQNAHPEDALRLEMAIEEALEIEDRPLTGEVKRRPAATDPKT